MCCLTNGWEKNSASEEKKAHSTSLMKDRLVITSHYWVARQRPQTFLLTKHTHTVVVNFQFFCLLCRFCCAYFFLYTFKGHLSEKKTTLYSLFDSLSFSACAIFSVCLPLSVLSVSLSLSHWWVVRKGLSALLYKLCFKNLLEATGSAFKYSHLTHPNRGS